MRLMLGGFVAPSLIWPFRKYFIPPAWPLKNFYAIEWASTYYNQPYTRKIDGIAMPPEIYGPFPGEKPYAFNYFFVGKDGAITLPSPKFIRQLPNE